MLAKLIFWLLGSCELRVAAENADRTAALLVRSGANFRRLHRSEAGLFFSLPLADVTPFLRLAERSGISVERLRERGLPALLFRYRRRFGIPLGVGMLAAILFLSEQYIWTIDVVGNESVSRTQLLSRLEALGVGVGSYIPGIDFDWVHNQYLIEYDDLAWLAINVRGTDATVEVRERQTPPAVPDEATPHNLIAAEDGLVRSVEILRGERVAEVDALVRAGELLASGVEETKNGLRLVHARGSVMAEVKRSFSILVPLHSEEWTFTGREYCEKYLNFFGISLKFFSNSGSMPESSETIRYEKASRERRVCLLGEVELPLSICEVVYREAYLLPMTLGEEEARAEAYRRLRSECATALGSSELLSRRLSAGMTSEGYQILCELHILTDIAKEAPIYLTGAPREDEK